MKISLIILGEGRGHITQALSVIDLLIDNGHSINSILIGKNSNREINYSFFDKSKYNIEVFDSPHFIFNDNGKSVSYFRTIISNLSPKSILKFLKSLRKIDKILANDCSDLVINFYEPLFGIYPLFFKRKFKIISIAHQFVSLNRDSVYLKETHGSYFIKLLSKIIAIKSDIIVVLSLYPYFSENKKIKVIAPILRDEIIQSKPSDDNFILCYILNRGFADDIIKWHSLNPDVTIHLFWDNFDEKDNLIIDNNLYFHHINNDKFIDKLRRCSGVITTAGFETVCEAVYLNKPVIMMPTHIEQEANANEFEWLCIGANRVDNLDVTESLSKLTSGYRDPARIFQLKNRIVNSKSNLITIIESLN